MQIRLITLFKMKWMFYSNPLLKWLNYFKPYIKENILALFIFPRGMWPQTKIVYKHFWHCFLAQFFMSYKSFTLCDWLCSDSLIQITIRHFYRIVVKGHEKLYQKALLKHGTDLNYFRVKIWSSKFKSMHVPDMPEIGTYFILFTFPGAYLHPDVY